MEDFNEASFEFEDQYIPSGNWYPLTHDDSNTESFFPENCPLGYFENTNDADQKRLQNLDSLSNDTHTRTLPQITDCDHFTSHSFKEQSKSGMQENDPFSVRCRIPVPDLVPVSGYQLWLETSFMCRRNERERQRVRSVNDGFSRLRNHLPRNAQIRRRQSKVETLRHAINYIKQLQMMLDSNSNAESNGKD